MSKSRLRSITVRLAVTAVVLRLVTTELASPDVLCTTGVFVNAVGNV